MCFFWRHSILYLTAVEVVGVVALVDQFIRESLGCVAVLLSLLLVLGVTKNTASHLSYKGRHLYLELHRFL